MTQDLETINHAKMINLCIKHPEMAVYFIDCFGWGYRDGTEDMLRVLQKK